MTWNPKDFNRSELRRQGLDVYNPDRMLAQWWQEDAGAAPRGASRGYVAWAANPRRFRGFPLNHFKSAHRCPAPSVEFRTIVKR